MRWRPPCRPGTWRRPATNARCTRRARRPPARSGRRRTRRARPTAAAPLATSSAKVIAPARAPTVRSTLAVPMLPLPKSRTSRPPTALPTIRPKGTDPIRYPAAQLAAAAALPAMRPSSLAPDDVRRPAAATPGDGRSSEGRRPRRMRQPSPAGTRPLAPLVTRATTAPPKPAPTSVRRRTRGRQGGATTASSAGVLTS